MAQSSLSTETDRRLCQSGINILSKFYFIFPALAIQVNNFSLKTQKVRSNFENLNFDCQPKEIIN